MTITPRIFSTLLVVLVLNACSEAPARRIFTNSWEPRPVTPMPPANTSAAELRQCPNLAGKFENESSMGQSPKLERLFTVRGFKTEPQHFFGADQKGGPVSTTGNAIDLLGGIENGIRSYYRPRSLNQRYTIEIQHTKPQMVWLVVRSSTGEIGKGEALFFIGGVNTCRNGLLHKHEADGTVYMSWWIDPDSGDIMEGYGKKYHQLVHGNGSTDPHARIVTDSTNDSESLTPSARYKRLTM